MQKGDFQLHKFSNNETSLKWKELPGEESISIGGAFQWKPGMNRGNC